MSCCQYSRGGARTLEGDPGGTGRETWKGQSVWLADGLAYRHPGRPPYVDVIISLERDTDDDEAPVVFRDYEAEPQ
jgi:hypothetical protein